MARKIILSRKFADSRNGGCACAILVSTGEVIPFPILESMPTRRSLRYRDLYIGGHSIGQMVHDLGCDVSPDDWAHPDLHRSMRPRKRGWRPTFGQAKEAERHLQNEGVGPGDTFLYFLRGRLVEEVGGTYRYVRGAPYVHVIHGWLQIGRRMPVRQLGQIPAWAADNPHYKKTPYPCHRWNQDECIDSIYLPTRRLQLPGVTVHNPGAGVFRHFHPALQLTAPNQRNITHWRWPLPLPASGELPRLSFHTDPKQWSVTEEGVFLDIVDVGQEFVQDCEGYPEAFQWLASLLDFA